MDKKNTTLTVSYTEDKKIMVSICCITYNQEQYIAQTIESFLMQKVDFKYEILINDDASTDRTADIIREYEKKYPDIIKPIYQSINQYSRGITNPSGAFNYPRASGKYIAMCEGDDYWTDIYKLKKQVDFLESHKNCSLCLHAAKTLVVDGSFTGSIIRPYNKSRFISTGEVIDKSSAYPTASLMFRSCFARYMPDYYTNCPVGDIPLQLHLASMGRVYYMDEVMSVYRIGGKASWSVLMKKGDYKKKQEIYYKQMKIMYIEFDRASKGRYTNYIKNAIRRIRFLTYVNTKNYSRIFSSKYRRFYKELDLRTRFFTGFEYHFPFLYSVARYIMRCI